MSVRGFTLVELVASMAILAVIGAVSLVTFNSIFGKSLETDARALLSDLQWARAACLGTHENYTVEFDVSGETYSISNETIYVKNRKLSVDLQSVVDSGSTAQTMLNFSVPFAGSDDRIITLAYRGKTRVITAFSGIGNIDMQ